jgi:hypothetical protein
LYTTLVSVVPPLVEPVTVTLARRHCRIDTVDDDDLLAIYITTARLLAENFLSRALITQTLAYSISQSPPTGGWPVTLMAPIILPLWLPFELLYQRPIELPRAPVQSIVSVTSTNPDGTTNTLLPGPTGYSFDTTLEPSRILLGSGYQPLPEQDVTITFVAGYGDTSASVPQQIVTAILFTVAWLYEHRGDEAMEMPSIAYTLMTPHRLVTFGA